MFIIFQVLDEREIAWDFIAIEIGSSVVVAQYAFHFAQHTPPIKQYPSPLHRN